MLVKLKYKRGYMIQKNIEQTISTANQKIVEMQELIVQMKSILHKNKGFNSKHKFSKTRGTKLFINGPVFPEEIFKEASDPKNTSIADVNKSPNEWERRVAASLNPKVIESIFRDFSSLLNSVGDIGIKGDEIIKGSIHMNLENGLWYRFSQKKGGDIFSFVTLASNCDKHKAIDIVAAYSGLEKISLVISNNKGTNEVKESKDAKKAEVQISTSKKDNWAVCEVVPDDALKFIPDKHLAYLISNGEQITDIYEYRNISGALLGYSVRTEDRDLKKQVRPVAYMQNIDKNFFAWKMKGFLDNGYKPLYRAEFLKDNTEKPILIVEGEKTANKASILFPEFTVISWMGGVCTIDKVNWELLRDRIIVIWPDNDLPGEAAANSIRTSIDRVNGIQGKAKIVNIEDLHLPLKWDLADPFPAGLDIDHVKNMLLKIVRDGDSLLDA